MPPLPAFAAAVAATVAATTVAVRFVCVCVCVCRVRVVCACLPACIRAARVCACLCAFMRHRVGKQPSSGYYSCMIVMPPRVRPVDLESYQPCACVRVYQRTLPNRSAHIPVVAGRH